MYYDDLDWKAAESVPVDNDDLFEFGPDPSKISDLSIPNPRNEDFQTTVTHNGLEPVTFNGESKLEKENKIEQPSSSSSKEKVEKASKKSCIVNGGLKPSKLKLKKAQMLNDANKEATSKDKSSTATSGEDDGKSIVTSKDDPSKPKKIYGFNEKDVQIAILESRVKMLRKERDVMLLNFRKKAEEQDDQIELLKWKVKYLEGQLERA